MNRIGIFERKANVTQADTVRLRSDLEWFSLGAVLECIDTEIDSVPWAAMNRNRIDALVLSHGAVLLRGFPLTLPADFERLSEAIMPNLFADYGDLPREHEGQRIYGSTVYPRDETILYHNESSHQHRWPLRISFCCVTAAQFGGETPLVDCRKVLQRLPTGIANRFRDKGLIYVRNFINNVDVSWQRFFGHDDREAVENTCRHSGMDYTWTPSGLRTVQPRAAITRHPITKEEIFFNQILLHHPSMLNSDVRRSLIDIFGEDSLPRNVLFGDGTAIEDEIVELVRSIYDELAVSFAWQEGDVIVVDNMLVAHARKPFSGPRKILVALADLVDAQGLTTT